MSLLFNMLSRLVITSLPKSKHFLISCLQSPSAVILELKKIKSVTVSTISPSIYHEVMGLVLEKAEEPEIKLPASAGSSKKQESSRRTSTSALLNTPKPLTVWITTNYRNFLNSSNYYTIAFISHTSKVMQKFYKPGFNSM